MSKFEIKATELVGTDVNFVSLVKRGANRIPFRLTKGENEMFDLHKIGRDLFRKGDKPATDIIAVVCQKGVDMKAVAEVFKANGLDPKEFQKHDQNGVVTVAKGDISASEDVKLLKVSNEIAIVYKSFDSSSQGSDDFNQVNSTGGHHLAIMAAHDALGTTMHNALQNAKDPQEAHDKIAAACDAHKEHVTGLTKKLPVRAFKMEVGLRAIKGCGTGNAGGGTDDDQETGPDGKFVKGKAKKEVAGNEDEALNKKGPVDAKKADAGKNGTGAGFEGGAGTGTNSRATDDDEKTPKTQGTPNGKTSGSDDGMPAKAKAPTKKDDMDLDKVPTGSTKRNEFRADGDKDGDDDTVMTGFVPGDDDGFAASPEDSKAAAARATADDKKTPGTQGKPGGATLDMDGVPAKAKSPTAKNDGDADVGQKDKGNKLPDDQSGAGAQQKDVQTLKSEDILAAIEGLKKSLSGAIAGVAQKVEGLTERVDGMDEMVQKADAALNGTVFADAGDDQPTRTSKSDDRSGGIPLIDTAFNRKNAA